MDRPLRSLTRALLGEGARHLAGRDKELARVHARLGDPPIRGRRPGFSTLIEIMFEQQVWLRSAAAQYCRIEDHIDGMSPANIDRVGANVSALCRSNIT